MVSLYSHEKLQQFSENLNEDNFLFDRNAKSIGNSNLSQNDVNHQNICLDNFTDDIDDVFEEVPHIANTLIVKSESVKQEDIEIKEEKLCEFKESNEYVDMAADTMNLESIGRIQQTEITSNASEALIIIKIENVEDIGDSVKSPSQTGIDTKETIDGSNDDILYSPDKKEPFVYCNKCYYRTRNKLQLNRHYLLHDGNAKLQSHMKDPDSEHKTHLSLRCEECPYETGAEVDMEFHLKAHQSKEKISKCPECYYITICSTSLKNHIETHGIEPETFQCQNCDYLTRRHINLVTHLLIHQNNGKFPCHKCSYHTKNRSSLVKHMLTHGDIYNFPCDKCNYKAKTKYHLVRHMLTHQENYNFACDKCSYRAKIKVNLVKHMLIHQDKRNFSCDKCGYQAKRKTDVDSHMLIHEENYNFKCHKCSYQAKRKCNLVNHMLVHQKKYKFSCDQCTFGTKTQSNLVRHMLSH